MTPNQAFMLLDAIHSYVVIKLEQIEKALQFQRLPVAERFTQGARYHEEMKALHLPGNRKLTAHQTSDETSI